MMAVKTRPKLRVEFVLFEKLVGLLALFLSACVASGPPSTGTNQAGVIYRDDFRGGLKQWQVEAEDGAQITATAGRMEIVAPGGATIWFRPKLQAPVEISYTVTAIDEGGPYDRVSDLNQFWMARDDGAADFFAEGTGRSGRFAQYDTLNLYYVGMGGHNNSRTRFRRYIGVAGERPLLPEHDLTAPEFLLEPNVSYRIRIVSEGSRQRFYRDGQLLFDLEDAAPYPDGHFGFRTVRNHMTVEDFQVRQLDERE